MAPYSAEELKQGVPAAAFAARTAYEASLEYLQLQRTHAAEIVVNYLTLENLVEIMPILQRMQAEEVARRQNGE